MGHIWFQSWIINLLFAFLIKFLLKNWNLLTPSIIVCDYIPLLLCTLYKLNCLVLGGKSYAPGEEHPFSEFELQLTELVKLMEKVQSKLEETQDPSSAIEKVSSPFVHARRKSRLCSLKTRKNPSKLVFWKVVWSLIFCTHFVGRELINIRIRLLSASNPGWSRTELILRYCWSQPYRYRGICLVGGISPYFLLHA